MKRHDLKDIQKGLNGLTPERVRVARIFKSSSENAIYEIGPNYRVDLQGDFNATPIRITIEISHMN